MALLAHWLLLATCPLLLLPAAFLLIRLMLVVVTVESQSMSPALEDGDRVLVLRNWPTRWLRKGQIVLVWPWLPPGTGPNNWGTVIPYIKRIIGMPGDSLVTSIDELNDYHRPREQAAHDSEGKRLWHVPPAHFFVRGDNAIGGFDSLTWGPIPYRSLLGIVIMKLPRRPLGESTPTTGLQKGLTPGQPAPDFVLETLEGETVTLATYAKRAVALLLFSPDFALCRSDLALHERLQPQARQAGVELVLVSIASASGTREFFEENPTSLPVLLAPWESSSFMQDYSIPGAPWYCLIDEHGTVRSAGHQSYDGGDWKSLIESWQ